MSNSQPDPTQRVELPCDFLAFLQHRLGGVEAGAATDVLAQWLAHYEPGPVARANANAVVSVKARRASEWSQEIHTNASAA